MGIFFSLLLQAAAALAFIGGIFAGFFLKDWKSAIFGCVSFAIVVAIHNAAISKETRAQASSLLEDVGFLLKLLLYIGGGVTVGGFIGYFALSWFGVLAGVVIGGGIGIPALATSD